MRFRAKVKMRSERVFEELNQEVTAEEQGLLAKKMTISNLFVQLDEPQS